MGARERRERGDKARSLRALVEATVCGDPLDVQEASACCVQAVALAEELGMRPARRLVRVLDGAAWMSLTRGDQGTRERYT